MVNSQSIVLQVYIILVFFTVLNPNRGYAGVRKYTKDDLMKLREEVREMFNHAYSGYLKYAYPYDELRPLTCDGVDTWGSYSLTLIDALDTLAVMGNYSEFRRVVDIVTSKANFDANINVSVFETNIRIVGGLLSAHMLSQRAGVELEPGWPCNGPLLRLAEDVAKRLLAAFDTSTGMPYGTVNLRHGVPPGETSVTCTAAVGTYLLEFSALSRLTGDPIYEEVALNALHALYHHRSSIGLYGNHIDVMTGRWTAQDSGIGAGVDSFFEYLVKGAILIQRPELMVIFHEARAAIDKYLKRNDWYLWASMHKGQITLPIFQSLEAYWPGVLSLIGDISTALKSMHNYHQVWKQYGFTPELYNIPQGQVGANRESYPLRPELIESAMYLYRATGDPFMLDVGTDILRSIQHSARTKCGYATIKDCRDHSLENRMESFFLSETTKYLYLLFDTDNFIHNDGGRGLVHTLPSGKQCILDAGGYIFNTEAHPLDPGTLLCCSEDIENKKHYNRRKARGVKLNSFVKPVQENPSHTDNFQTTESAEKILLDQLPSSKTEESQPLLDQLPSALTEEFQPLLDQLPSALTEESQPLLDQLPPTLTEKSQPLLDQLPSVLTEESQSLHGESGIKVDDEKSGEVLYFNNNNPSDEESQQSSLKKKTLSLGSLEIMETLINSYLKNSLIKTMWSRDLLHDLVRLIENTDIKNDQSYELPEEKRESTISDIKSIPSSVGNLEDSSLMKTEKVHAKGNKIFDLIITQQFITIKNTIAVEADNVMLHVYKCIENLELTKDLVDIAIENQLENEFFTKRLKIRGLATQITETVEESRKLIQIGESKDTVSLTFFKALVGSVVNGKTVNSFFKEYERYMELLKNLIKVGKRKYYDLEEKKMGNSEDGISNDSENVSNERDEVKQNHGSDSSKSNIQNNNWKADGISYEVDDRERVTPVTKVDSGPLFTDKLTISPVEDIIGYLSKSLIPTETPFNPQVLLERIRSNPRYPRNETWMTRYELLTCLPQPYFTRITLYGEFFDES